MARALNEVGDWWSLRLVLQAMHGTRRFVDFQQELGIARNILCDRLNRLVEHEVLRKVDVGEHGSRYEYRLTDKGPGPVHGAGSAAPVGRQMEPGGRSSAPEPADRKSGQPVSEVRVRDADGQPLNVRDVVL